MAKDGGIQEENEIWLNKLMRQYRDKFIKEKRKNKALKRTLHIVCDAAIEQNKEIVKLQNKLIKYYNT